MESPSRKSGLEQPALQVLIVEDDREVRELLVDLLESRGYWAIAAEDGDQALLKAKAYQPNVVLLDQTMPVMNGRQFLEEQKKEPSIAGIPVVVFSAYENNLPVAGYLQKPVRLDDVLEAVNRYASPAGSTPSS